MLRIQGATNSALRLSILGPPSPNRMNGALPIFPVGPGWIYQDDGSSASDSVSHRGEQSSRERAQHDDRERLVIQKQEGQ